MPELLSGSAAHLVAENVRTLRTQGYAESDAIRKARKYAQSESDDPVDRFLEPVEESTHHRQFVIVTQDFSGLGWAKKLQEEGETVTIATEYPKKREEKPGDEQRYQRIGESWIDVMPLKQALQACKSPTTYWIFSENACVETAEKLRAEGQKVFGTSTLSDRMEHDRPYACQVAEEAGLASPPTETFTSREDGLNFLAQNPDKAYVLKPNDGKFSYLTFIPSRRSDPEANQECQDYLRHLAEEPTDYILQERISDGIEVNVEVWLYEGEPFFTMYGLENKRKNASDIGEMSGCAGDCVQVLPLDHKLVQETIGLMLPFYREQGYTGFADVNVLYTPDGPLFLEVCNRFGYNSHATLLLGLLTGSSLGNLLADYTDGRVGDIAERFRGGVAASLTLFLDHPREGLPLHVDPRWDAQFYPFDGYLEDDTMLLTGYSSEIGIFVGYGETIEAAAASCLDKIVLEEAVSVPDMHYRTDLGLEGYTNAPVARFKALQGRGLLP